ncbi:MAG: hypothetical protein KGZ58_05225, partial [Ignavibacteriales bacterium]|nr:hypothetical protein [Ignavibacteriales bacterium]
MLKFIIQLSLFTLLISSSTFSGIVQSTTTGGNWNSTSTWQGGAVPIDNDDVIIATTGANSVVVNVNTAKIGSLVINSGSILQGGGSFTLLVGGTSGNDVLNNGTIEAINITVKLQSHSTFVGNGTYNLYRIDFNGKNLTLRSSSPDTLHFSAPGDPFTNIGNLLDTGWVFDYNGTSVQYLSDDNEAYFDHIDISNSAGVRLLQNLTTTYLRGNLVVRPGAILHTGSYTITGSSGKIFALDSNATFNDSVTFPTGFSTYSLNVASTVNYMSVGSQTISSTPAYGNLTFSGGGTKTAGGDLTVNGNFTMGGSTTFNGGTSRSHTFKGDWTNNSSAGTPFTYTTASTIIMATPSTPTSTAFGGSTSATTAFNNFTVSNTSGVTASKNFSSSGTFSIQSNATFTPDASVIVSGTGALTVTGTLKVTRTSVTANLVNQYTLSGTKTLTGGTVDFAGTGEIVDNLSYGNLTISGTASINSTFSVVPTGNFIVTGTATLNASQTSAFGGNTTVSGTGILDITAVTFSQSGRTLTLSTGGTLKTSGTFPTFSTYSLTGGTVEYYGTASQSVSAQSYGNLSLSGARTTNSITVPSSTMFISGTFSPTATFSSGNYIITGNTIDFNGSGSQIIPAFNYNNLTSSSSGGRTLASSGTIGISGVFTPGTNSYTNTGSTINFNGSGTQTISAFNYNNLTSSSSGTRILSSSGTIGIAEVFTQGSNSYTIAGSTIDFNGSGSQTIPAFTYQNLISSSSGARTLASSGTITLNGAFTPGTNSYTVTGSTISYVSSSSQAIASFSYNNLTIAGSGNQTADGDITTNGVLSLNNNLDMGSNTLTMGSASTTLGTYDVKGKVRRTSFTPSTEYTFGNRYTSVTFGSGGTFPTQIDVTISIGAAPSGKSDAILRSYVITATGGSGYSSTLRLHYLNGELNGNTPTQLSLWKFITSWNDLGRLGSVDTTSNYAELDGISSFETFTLANASLDHFDVSFNSPQTVGTAFTGTNTITARDQNNNLLTTYSAAANNVSVTSTPTDGTIYGLGSGNNAVLNQAENFVNGVCSVTSQLLFIGTNGNHTFTATSSNGKTGTSGTVTLETGTAVRLAFSTQPGDGIERQNLSAQPQVTIQDTGGNTVTTASNSVSLAIANNPSGGSLSTDSNPLNATSGVATFSGVRINKAGTGYTLSATTSGLTSATSSTFTISNQTPTITTISPMNKARGDDGFTITISGTRFVYNSVVQYAGSNRTTTFFNDSVLTAEITASDLFTAGIYGITVVNPAPGGGTSNEVSFTVLTASISGTVISDSNGNGSREGFESGLQNWRVRLAKNGVP